jgi:hypothetical protein
MEITGELSEFPLPELLQFLDRRQATGSLSLDVFSNYYAELQPQHYTIWLNQGHIVLVQRGDYRLDVYTLAIQKEWIRPFVANKLKERSPQSVAAGLYLELQGVLNFEQLRSLFFSEVVHRVEGLFDTRNAKFTFQTNPNLPLHEMTGFSISATKVAMQGFRSDRSLLQLRDALSSIEHSQIHSAFCTTPSEVHTLRI